MTYDEIEILSRVQPVYLLMHGRYGIRQYNSRINLRRRLKLLLSDVFIDWRQGHGQAYTDVDSKSKLA